MAVRGRSADQGQRPAVADQLDDPVAIKIGVELIGAGSVIGMDREIRPAISCSLLCQLLDVDRQPHAAVLAIDADRIVVGKRHMDVVRQVFGDLDLLAGA